ncbi:hypothetical protein AAFF_G00061210 [Aldrovandia affinis]|uniref:Uncharacterized protein n=1 Tax=Aldrovandia affinis TaxID=143900 RepID=A0AAD7RZW6_9TELE|nr:hypothetical protein AAFF_G00061210 [Aldrovandia affinis]
MRVRLACLLFIFLAHGGMCSGANQVQKTREEDLLSGLFSSEVSLSLWRAVLWDMCGWSPRLNQQGSEAWLGGWEGHASIQLYHLQDLCRLLQPGEEDRLFKRLESTQFHITGRAIKKGNHRTY